MNREHGPSEQDMAWKAENMENRKKSGGSFEYETASGEKVSLQWQVIYPENGSPTEGEVVIFLPGIALDADSKSVIDSTENLANVSKLPAYSITTRVESAEAENSQSLQAEAIHQLIKEKGFKEVTLVGNSQGANKAISVNSEIKHKSPNVNVRGLILTAPGGLYDQDGPELTKNFFKDSLLGTSPAIIKDSKIGSVRKVKNTLGRMGRAIKIGNDVGQGMGKEFLTAPSKFGKRVAREGNEAATRNPQTEEIDSPIVIILGDKDIAFRSDKLISEDAHDQSQASQKLREKQMKEIFPNSPAIRVLEGSKDAVHGMHYIRGDKVTNSGWHMLQRIEREV
jgi:pimeloyl-ACP methyl ester carboxylesterase